MVNGTPAIRRIVKEIHMPDFTVHAYGTDTSGRTIYMTAYMHDWWEGVVAELGFRPTIVQGAFMTRNGGGADSSAGYHDQGGCFDVRTWDLTAPQKVTLVRACRARGGAAWRRDKTPLHGDMDEHCHITLGSDHPLSAGAAESWRSYLAGDNGLANNAPDYEWRPSPLVTTPPERDWFDMATEADLRKIVGEEFDKRRDAFAAATAKAVMDSDVVSKLDVSVREALRAAFNDSGAKPKKG